ncbi:hypothetical protein SAMN05519104_1666 [Rhizobiales bacterium GAS188]|nr:hypothetical protein SAMN05519104_1666 [Rhizobiales bacterium GAS188]
MAGPPLGSAFVEKPPQLLDPHVQRFDAQGRPTPDQVLYEGRLQQYLVRLIAGYVPLNASGLPTADPHVVGQVWRNAGVLTVSAG